MRDFMYMWLFTALVTAALLWWSGLRDPWLLAAVAVAGMPLLNALYAAWLIRGYRFPSPLQWTPLEPAAASVCRHRDYAAWDAALQQRGYRRLGLVSMAFGALSVSMDCRCHDGERTLFFLWHPPFGGRLYAKLSGRSSAGRNISVHATPEVLPFPDPQEDLYYVFSGGDLAHMEACLHGLRGGVALEAPPQDLAALFAHLTTENRRVAEYYIGCGYLYPPVPPQDVAASMDGDAYAPPRRAAAVGLRLRWRGLLHYGAYVPPWSWWLYRRARTQNAALLRKARV